MKPGHMRGSAAATSRLHLLPACTGAEGLPLVELAEIVPHWLSPLSGLGVCHG